MISRHSSALALLHMRNVGRRANMVLARLRMIYGTACPQYGLPPRTDHWIDMLLAFCKGRDGVGVNCSARSGVMEGLIMAFQGSLGLLSLGGKIAVAMPPVRTSSSCDEIAQWKVTGDSNYRRAVILEMTYSPPRRKNRAYTGKERRQRPSRRDANNHSFAARDRFHNGDEKSAAGVGGNLREINQRLNSIGQTEGVTSASKLFAQVKNPDVVTFNTMMKLYASARDSARVREFFKQLLLSGTKPNVISYSIVVGALASSGDLAGAKQVLHSMAVRPNAITYLGLMKEYGKRNDVKEMLSLLEEMKVRGIGRSPASYNVLLNVFCKTGKLLKAAEVLQAMEEDGVEPTRVSYATLMAGQAVHGDIDAVLRTYATMCERSVQPDVHVYSVLIEALIESDRLEQAQDLVDEMKLFDVQPNEVTFLAMMKLPAFARNPARMLECIRDMQNVSLEDKQKQICTAVSTLARCGYKDAAETFLKMATEQKVLPVTVAAWNALIKANASDSSAASQLVTDMQAFQIRPNEVTVCTLIDAYIRCGELDTALATATKMCTTLPKLGVFTFSTLMKLHRERGEPHLVQRTFDQMQRAGIPGNQVVYSTLISAYGRAGDVENAKRTYDQMKPADLQPNQVVCGALIHALASNGDIEGATLALSKMQAEGIEPNSFAYTTIVNNLAAVGRTEEAKDFIEEAEKRGIEVAKSTRQRVELEIDPIMEPHE